MRKKSAALMADYGFAVDLPRDRGDDLRARNDQEFPDCAFTTEGFPVTGGRCREQVWCYFHAADDDRELVAGDVLEFMAGTAAASASGSAPGRGSTTPPRRPST